MTVKIQVEIEKGIQVEIEKGIQVEIVTII